MPGQWLPHFPGMSSYRACSWYGILLPYMVVLTLTPCESVNQASVASWLCTCRLCRRLPWLWERQACVVLCKGVPTEHGEKKRSFLSVETRIDRHDGRGENVVVGLAARIHPPNQNQNQNQTWFSWLTLNSLSNVVYRPVEISKKSGQFPTQMSTRP